MMRISLNTQTHNDAHKEPNEGRTQSSRQSILNRATLVQFITNYKEDVLWEFTLITPDHHDRWDIDQLGELPDGYIEQTEFVS
jgi:hypothetical protein